MGLLNPNVQTTLSVTGTSFTILTTITGNNDGKATQNIGVAQPGTLTTRSSETAGTLTMTNMGHGITTGALLDIYWTGGRCYQALVGTVSGTSVPFTLAQGTALPIATTPIIAQMPTAINFPVSANINLLTVAMQTNWESQFTFYDNNLAKVDWNQYFLPSVAGQIGSTGWVSGLGSAPFPINGLCAPPVQSVPTAANGGSLVTSDTYYWVITALNGNGETLVSNQETLTVTSPDLTADLVWAAVPNAAGYKIYRSLTSNTYGASSLVTHITNPATTTYADTGSALTSGTPPTVNGAVADTIAVVYVSHSDPNASHVLTACFLGT